MTLSIELCLWIDSARAVEAVDFYVGLFPESQAGRIDVFENSGSDGEETIFAGEFSLAGRNMQLIGAHPHQQPNPSISLKFAASDRTTVERIGRSLLDGGAELMPFGSYPWSDYFGWVVDRYGISWQVLVEPDRPAQLAPALMFVGDQNGRAAEAIELYTSLFPDSGVEVLQRFGDEDADQRGNVFFAKIRLAGRRFDVTDSGVGHAFGFNDMVSLAVLCDGQDEVDRYWNGLLSGGGEPVQCGWLKDRFGVSWQIVPRRLNELLRSSDSSGAAAVMRCMLGQVKIDLAELETAYISHEALTS